MTQSNGTSSSPPYVKTPRPKKICIIGGGVAGLAALRTLVEEGNPFEKVELIERRDNIGGVWYLNEQVVKHEKAHPGGTASFQWPITVPTDGDSGHTNGNSNGNSASSKPAWPSPAYPALRGNVLPRFLTFAGGPAFPTLSDPEDSFPSLAETQTYLEMVAKPLQSYVRYNTECIDVRELPGRHHGENRWAVRIRDWNLEGGPTRTEYYDAVVMSIGWTDKPLFPKLQGLEEAKSAGLVEHAKWYRGPDVYDSNSRIVVVGNGNSGNDIAAQLAAHRTLGEHDSVFRVARHKPWYFYVSLPDPRIKDVPALNSLSLTANDKKVSVKLIDGSEIKDVDRIIFASGYEIGRFPNVHLLTRQPFASEDKLLPPLDHSDASWQAPSDLASLWTSLSSPLAGTSFNSTDNPERVSQLFYQILHSRASTLALINLTVTSIPFWCSDLQAHLIRAIWDGSYTLPDKLQDRCEYETNRINFLAQYKAQEPERFKVAQEQLAIEQKEKGKDAYVLIEHTGGPPYHILGTIIDDYATALRDMAVSAKPEWESKLPDWKQYGEERNAMYDLKRRTLERRRKLGLDLV
jgi:hypothetical protein